MKIRKLIEELVRIENTYGNLEVIYSVDEDLFDFIQYDPTAGNIDSDRTFLNEEDCITEGVPVNCVCIN